jgi:hypothetical protein
VGYKRANNGDIQMSHTSRPPVTAHTLALYQPNSATACNNSSAKDAGGLLPLTAGTALASAPPTQPLPSSAPSTVAAIEESIEVPRPSSVPWTEVVRCSGPEGGRGISAALSSAHSFWNLRGGCHSMSAATLDTRFHRRYWLAVVHPNC